MFVATSMTGNNQFELVQVKELEEELDKFHSTLDVMKESLEKEKHCKGSLQISIKSLKEELAYRKEVHKEGKQRSAEVRDLTLKSAQRGNINDLFLPQQALFSLQRKLTASIHSGGREETDTQIKAGLVELREKRQKIVKFYSDKVCKWENIKGHHLLLVCLVPL